MRIILIFLLLMIISLLTSVEVSFAKTNQRRLRQSDYDYYDYFDTTTLDPTTAIPKTAGPKTTDPPITTYGPTMAGPKTTAPPIITYGPTTAGPKPTVPPITTYGPTTSGPDCWPPDDPMCSPTTFAPATPGITTAVPTTAGLTTSTTTLIRTIKTTTPTPTEAITTTSAGENEEPKCHPDIGFVLDVAMSDPVSWDIEKQFILKLANRSGMSENGAHVSVATFSSECPLDCVSKPGPVEKREICPYDCPNDRPDAELMIKFNEYIDFRSFEMAVYELRDGGLGHLMDKGMEIALNDMFQKKNGMRTKSPKTFVMITDGHQSGVDYAKWGQLFDDANIRVVLVGIGKDVKTNVIVGFSSFATYQKYIV